jgi:hypothetical protein
MFTEFKVERIEDVMSRQLGISDNLRQIAESIEVDAWANERLVVTSTLHTHTFGSFLVDCQPVADVEILNTLRARMAEHADEYVELPVPVVVAAVEDVLALPEVSGSDKNRKICDGYMMYVIQSMTREIMNRRASATLTEAK